MEQNCVELSWIWSLVLNTKIQADKADIFNALQSDSINLTSEMIETLGFTGSSYTAGSHFSQNSLTLFL